MVEGIHEDLASMWSAKVFEPQIHYVRFPRFRNLSDGLRIDFTHPLTAIVGPNGTNKSSILRAVQGCPDQENIGRYWFGTDLDAIPEGERHRFIHGRWSDSANGIVEVVKSRILRRTASDEVDPDYFEPARPIIADGMSPMPEAARPLPPDRTATRWKAIEKNVVYIDFRAEISAFDKYFFHHDYRARRADGPRSRDPLASRRALIRERSPRVRRLLDERLLSYSPGGKQWVIVPARRLSSTEVQEVGAVLGRQYSRIDVISHRAFEVGGTTARLHTSDFSYSEAWAGSGEFAAVQVVTAVLKAEPKSLVLLDEPEVSLHPGAQRRLLAFLSSAARDLKLQIVFATHSPVLLEDLPPEAIKVLDIDPGTHRVVLRSQASSPETAFSVLEHRFAKKTVVVEDALARQVVLRALRGGGDALLSAIDVKELPGGAGTLRCRYLPTWALDGRVDTLLLLDGDMSVEPPARDGQSTPPGELEHEAAHLMGVSDVRKHIPADTGGATDAQLRAVLDWGSKYLQYLPGRHPESWLHATAMAHGDADPVGKDWWEQDARRSLGKAPSESVTATEILEHQKRALATIPDDHKDLVLLREAISATLGIQ